MRTLIGPTSLWDPHSEKPREHGQLANFVSQLEKKQILDGHVRDFKEFAGSLQGTGQREIAKALLALCEEELDQGEYDGIIVYRYQADSNALDEHAESRIGELLNLKQKKRIRDRVAEVEDLLRAEFLTKPSASPGVLRARMSRLLTRAKDEHEASPHGKAKRDCRRALDTVLAICSYIESELENHQLDQHGKVKIPLLTNPGRWLLDEHLSRYLQSSCKASAGAVRKRMSRLAKTLRAEGLLQEVNSSSAEPISGEEEP